MTQITHRICELTNHEQRFFNAYINAIASGGTFQPIERLKELVEELRTTPKKEQAHQLAVMTDILYRLSVPRDLENQWL
jgi:hypothetical protein